MCRQGGNKCEMDVYQRYNNTRCVFSRECALFGAHVDDEQVPKISSEISPHINDKQLGRLNSYWFCRCHLVCIALRPGGACMGKLRWSDGL